MSFSFKDELEQLVGKVTNEELDTVRNMVIEDLTNNGWYSRDIIMKAFEGSASSADISVVQGEILSTAVIALRVVRRLKRNNGSY